MRTIAIVNHQPESGKTTAAVNLSAALAKLGKATLLVDLDPAAAASKALGVEPGKRGDALRVLTFETTVPEIVVDTAVEGLSVLPADLDLAVAEYDLAGMLGGQFLLVEQLKQVREVYDFCIIDCRSELGLITTNGIVASDEIIIPAPHEICDYEAISRLLEVIEDVKKKFQPCSANLRGLLHTMAETKSQAGKKAQRKIRRNYKGQLLETVIDKTTALAEATAAAQPVMIYSPRSKATKQFKDLAGELSNDE